MARGSCVVVLAFCLQLGFVAAQDAPATDTPAAASSVILTINQDRLFTESAFGKASLERERRAAMALDAENKKIEADLITEEQDLTTRRATLPAAEFAALATAFDTKVEGIRDEQDAKVRALALARDEDRKAFLRKVGPILGELMGEKGASVILDKSIVILSLTAIDVTEEAITRVDAVLPVDTPVPPANP